MKKLFPLVLILFATPCFGESYLCIGESATEFASDNKFKQSNFIPNKWIIKKSEKFAWEVFQHGDDTPYLFCKKDSPTLNCSGFLGRLTMSKETLRFVRSYHAQYVEGGDSDDVAVEIGKCSKI